MSGHPIAPGRDQILSLPPMPSGQSFEIREIEENLQDVEDLPAGAPIELELTGPEGRGEAAEDGVLDAIEALPAVPPRARSAHHAGRRPRARQA